MQKEEKLEEELVEENLEDKPKAKRFIDLDDDDYVSTIFKIPKGLYKDLGHYAVEHGTSKAEVMRTAIKEFFEKDNPKPSTQKISDIELSKILKHCTKDEGFEIDGEDGFIEQMKAKAFKLKDLTPEQWEKVKEKLEIGYQGYWSKPELEEFAEKFVELEPTEEQKTWLSIVEEETEED